MPDGSSRILPGTQIAVGHLQIPTWGDGEVSVGPVYELISGDLDWWDNLITAATAVRNDLAKLLPEADRHVRR